MKKLELAAALGLIGTMFLGSQAEFSQKLVTLREDVLRLHILAHSDSEADQALKLHVRDTLLDASAALFAGCDSPEEIRERAYAQQETIRLLAQHAVEMAGYDYEVTVQLVQMDFDEKVYEELTMPQGTYDALRILIGDAEGQNWWCVMYPPLCLPAGTGVRTDAETAEDWFDPETLDVLEHPKRYEIRFKIVEWWDEWVKSIYIE